MASQCIRLSIVLVTFATTACLASCGEDQNKWESTVAPATGTPDVASQEEAATGWKKASLTNFTSYPAPGSDECENYNGCEWEGQFAFVDGKKSKNWVKAHNIVAVHERDASKYKLKTLRLKKGSDTIDVKVYDECADSDCSGCCTRNARPNGFLIDIEHYTMQRFGHGDGTIQWQCLDCN
jgi:hypothetical protein